MKYYEHIRNHTRDRTVISAKKNLRHRTYNSYNEEKEEWKEMEIAGQELADEYTNNKELTVFTNLDFENFYEAR
ncbi:MAG: hypothetical protein HYZ34_08990 [Ignavibacteriae bacterium]|nr:hypothetical protein [Ignavibacteriota bacterium]